MTMHTYRRAVSAALIAFAAVPASSVAQSYPTEAWDRPGLVVPYDKPVPDPCSERFTQAAHNEYVRRVFARPVVSPAALLRARRMRACAHSAQARDNMLTFAYLRKGERWRVRPLA
ncbi:MAG: hypothetical protein LC798_15650 [Chloroflexi bacterium]|nr:hypothetical protein [Chloroflexota bacterium]